MRPGSPAICFHAVSFQLAWAVTFFLQFRMTFVLQNPQEELEKAEPVFGCLPTVAQEGLFLPNHSGIQAVDSVTCSKKSCEAIGALFLDGANRKSIILPN